MHRLSYKDFFLFFHFSSWYESEFNENIQRKLRENWEKNEKSSGGKRNSHSWHSKKVVGMALIFSFFYIFSQFSHFRENSIFRSFYFIIFFVFLFATTKSALKTFLLSNHFFHSVFFVLHFPPNRVKEKPHFYLYFMMKKFS